MTCIIKKLYHKWFLHFFKYRKLTIFSKTVWCFFSFRSCIFYNWTIKCIQGVQHLLIILWKSMLLIRRENQLSKRVPHAMSVLWGRFLKSWVLFLIPPAPNLTGAILGLCQIKNISIWFGKLRFHRGDRHILVYIQYTLYIYYDICLPLI